LQTGGYIVSPPNAVCVTTLPCEILLKTLWHACLYTFSTTNTHRKYEKKSSLFTLDQTNGPPCNFVNEVDRFSTQAYILRDGARAYEDFCIGLGLSMRTGL